jgi:hypothetical protein
VPAVVSDGYEVESSTESEADVRAALAVEPPPAVPAPEPAATAHPTEPPAELPANEEEDDDDTSAASEAGKTLGKRKESLQQRNARITFNWRAAERERDELKRQLEELRTGKTPAAAADPAAPEYLTGPPPTEDEIGSKYETYDAYIRAAAKWEAKEELARERQASTVDARTRAFQEATHQTQLRGREKHADFDAITEEFTGSGRQFTPFMTDAILQHPHGHEIAYALMTDARLYEAIAKAPSWIVAMTELGKLLTRLEAAPAPAQPPKAAPVTSAKPPISPVGSSPVASDDGEVSDELDVDEHIRRMNAKDRTARRR